MSSSSSGTWLVVPKATRMYSATFGTQRSPRARSVSRGSEERGVRVRCDQKDPGARNRYEYEK